MYHQQNKSYHVLPDNNGNGVAFSKMSSYHLSKRSTGSLEIKYVLKGEEIYTMDKKRYKVSSNEFLLINPNHEFEAEIYTRESTIGLCIGINTEILADVFRSVTSKDDALLDNGGSMRNSSFEFFENIYSLADNESILKRLASYTADFNKEKDHTFNIDFFYGLAYDVILLDRSLKIKLQNLSSKTNATKRELYRRVKIARQMLDDNYLGDINLDILSNEVLMSKFHFLRTFKQVFGVTPYQYLITKKMNHATILLKDKHVTIHEIAIQLGFPDVNCFCKAFKKAYTIPPSQFRKAI